MSNSIECSWGEFKQITKEFLDEVDSMNQDELDNAWKCLGLAYLGMNESMWQDSAAILLNMAARSFIRCNTESECDIQWGPDHDQKSETYAKHRP